MLRNVLADYISGVQEREFDLPLLALLPTLGFYDIHFTHGQVEFGKDIIAKRLEDGSVYQYSFQSKAGDITQAEWRNNIMGQMLESILTGLSHPNFDKSLPHQSILVVTGRLIGNAALGLQELNKTIQEKYEKRPIIVWDREELISDLETFGLEGVYRTTASDFVSYGDFFILYGKCLQGNITERDIERHSRRWLDESVPLSKRLLAATIEAESIAQKCTQQGLYYEAIHSYLCAIRAILFYLQDEKIEIKRAELVDIYNQAELKHYIACKGYLNNIRSSWISSDKNLARLSAGPTGMFTYLVHCARIIETAGTLYFLEPDENIRQDITTFIEEFISHEPGSFHIPCDRYAVSLVLPILALCKSNRSPFAQEILRNTTVWLCNRVEDGLGIASIEASPLAEVTKLIGYPFAFIPQDLSRGSLLATVLCDLAAFLGYAQFYNDVVNDLMASGISPEYWQTPDTKSLFQIDGSEVIMYPNIEPKDNIGRYEDYDYAEHIKHEPRSYHISQFTNPFSLMNIMLLLRDRYFPTTWLVLIRS